MAENKHRWKIQLGAALASNPFLMNFLHGRISRTGLKAVCVPGLNCYSCPAAAASCPIGALQAVIGSSKFQFAWYVVGFLIFAGALLGRVVCGFLCPFGWFQELLHKIPAKKFSTRRVRILTYLKYGILALFVIVTKDGQTFKASQISREFSFARLNARLGWKTSESQQESERKLQQRIPDGGHLLESTGPGLFGPTNGTAPEEPLPQDELLLPEQLSENTFVQVFN